MKLPIDVKHILKQMGLGTYQIPKEKEDETEADQREAYEQFCNDHLPPIYYYGDGPAKIKEDSSER